jgi:hypothetical protein
MNTLTYVKLGVVFLAVAFVGAWVLAGKLEAAAAIAAITGLVSALVIALGIQNAGKTAGDSVVMAMRQHTKDADNGETKP